MPLRSLRTEKRSRACAARPRRNSDDRKENSSEWGHPEIEICALENLYAGEAQAGGQGFGVHPFVSGNRAAGYAGYSRNGRENPASGGDCSGLRLQCLRGFKVSTAATSRFYAVKP